jgi:hypothetical protein
VLRFGSAARLARKRPIGRLALMGTLRGAPGAIDPKRDGVTFSVATPQGERMAIFARALTMNGRSRRLVGRSSESGGVVTIALSRTASGYRVAVKGRRLDLFALAPATGDPERRDLTVALEVSGASFVRNRTLVARRNVFRLPRRRT